MSKAIYSTGKLKSTSFGRKGLYPSMLLQLVAVCLFALVSLFPSSALAQSPVSDPLPYDADYLGQCNANDAGSLNISNFQVLDPCVCVGDTTTLSFDYNYEATAQTRYDVRFGLHAQDGGIAKQIYQACLGSIATTGAGGFSDADGDGDCLDLASGGYSSNVVISLQCDPFNTGTLSPNFEVTPVLDWAPSASRSKNGQFSGPKCRSGIGANPNVVLSFPSAASIQVSKISNGGVGSFDYSLTNITDPGFIATCNGSGAATTVNGTITTTADGAAATDPNQFTVNDTSQPVVLTEVVPAGFELDGMSCTANGTAIAGTFDAAAGTFTIPGSTIQPGDDVQCTITNKVPNASILFQKTVINDEGGTAVAADWTFSAAGPTAVTDVAAGVLTPVSPGNYALSESGPAGYANTSLSCTGTADANPADGLDIADGEDAVCTFVNDDQSVAADPTLTLNKIVDNTGGGTAAAADWTLTATGPSTLSGPTATSGTVTAGDYVLTESGGPTDYALTLECTGASGGLAGTTVTLADGDAAVCTYTNTFQAAPSFTVAKTADAASLSAPGTITYQIQIANTGNVDLTGVSLADSLTQGTTTLALTSGPTLSSGDDGDLVLEIGETWIYTASFAVTQDQFDATGDIVNVVDVTTTETGATPVGSDPSTATTSLTQTLDFTFAKEQDGDDVFEAVGDILTYTFTITNTGSVTISSVTIDDQLIGPVTCPVTDLAPGASDTCSVNYEVTSTDFDNQSIVNTATATATDPTGGQLTSPDAVETSLLDLSQFTLSKTANVSSFTLPGEQIIYTLEVLNDGTNTLQNIVVTDSLDPTFSCTIASLDPGVSTDECTFTYTVTQDDIDTGSVVNAAAATHPDVAGPDVSSITVDGPTQLAEIAIEKTALDTFAAAGDPVRFAIRVQNTGNVTLDNVLVTDSSLFSPAETCPVGTIEPGFDQVVCTVTYIVQQSDVDAGSVSNLATVTADARDTGGSTLSEDGTATADGPAPNPSVSVDKSSTDGTFVAPTDSEVFTFVVTNTGNVTLTGLVFTDTDADGTNLTCPLDDLAPMETATTCSAASGGAALTFTKSLDQSDVDAGSYTNSAQVTGQTLVGAAPVSGSDIETISGPAPDPQLSLDKAETFGPASFSAVGESITYTYDVTNTGNITITAPISVTDAVTSVTPNVSVAVTCPPVPTDGLAPGATLQCTATYQTTQADLDAGQVTNLATADVDQPVPGGGTIAAQSNSDTETVPATQSPAMSMVKSIAATSPNTTYAAVGDQVIFEYTVTNSGNVTITDPITVTDNKIPGASVDCGPLPLAPGDAVSCQLTWTAEQINIDDGSVTNLATASSSQVPVDATDDFTTQAIQSPALAMTKTAFPVAPTVDGDFALGSTYRYDYVITNPGNTTIQTTPALVVTDNRIGSVSCPAGPPLLPLSEDPTGQVVCTATYVVTSDDLPLGEVTNLASVSDGTTTSPTVSETIPAGATPSMSLEKTLVSGADFNAVGDQIVYRFTVENTSINNLDFTEDVVIVDDKIGSFTCFSPSTTDPFSQGEQLFCEETYEVTQADLDAGQVTNEAVANTVFAPSGSNIPVVSAPDTVTVDAEILPGLTVAKDVTAGDDPASVGDILTYTILTTNTGNQTMSSVMVSDPEIPTLICNVIDGVSGAITAAPPNVVLAPGDVLSCTGDYMVTQADVDDQTIANTATATGNNPQGDQTLAQGTDNHPVEGLSGTLTVTKDVTPVGAPDYAAVGDTVTFVVTVTNDSNITVDNISVTDTPVGTTNAATPATCSVGTLAPGDSFSGCLFEVVVTQDEIDAGSFDNVATATGDPRSGDTLPPAEGSTTAQGPAAAPAFSLEKDADVTAVAAAGDLITYTYTITNAGNVTLFAAPQLTDDVIGAITCPALPTSGLAPAGELICTATYNATQDDADEGFVTNIASVESTEVTTPATATETVTIDRAPALTLVKTPSITADAALDDVITYTYTVTNTGNTRLFDVTVADTQTSALSPGGAPLTVASDTLSVDNGTLNDSTDAGADGVWDVLAPGDVVTFTASYTVTQADIDAGNALTNDATVNATGPPGTTPPEDDDSVSVPVEAADPELTSLKTIASSTGSAAGDTISFLITVQNTGNVTLAAPTLTDTLIRVDGTALSLTTGPDFTGGDAGIVGEMELGETWSYEATYQLTQADVDAGGVSNSVLFESTAPDGSPVEDTSSDGTPGDDSSPTVFTIPAAPAISNVKTITSTTVLVGELVTFEIVVSNDGNVSLDPITVTDTLTRNDAANTPLTLTSGPDFAESSLGSPEGSLLPGETATYRASYRLTQEDIDAGGISNTVTAEGAPPSGTPVSDVSNDTAADGDNPTVLVIPAAPALIIDKQLAATAPVSFDTLGQEIAFDFVITNDGNVTLDGPFTVSDALIEGQGNAVSCPAVPPLAPDASLTCTGSYFVTQDDLDNGGFTNAATASDGVTDSIEDTIFVPAVQTPAMDVTKTAETIAPADFDVGTTVDYDYVVENTGNVTLTDPITVDDNLIAAVTCPALPVGGLIPGESITCTGTYTVTADDVDLGSVTNLASSTSGTTESPLTSETIPEGGVPSLSIVKTPEAGASFAEVGDVIEYTFDVTNDGTRAFADEVRIFDDKINDTTGLLCFQPAAGETFSVGQTVSCTFPYTVTQDDLDAGEVINQAFAQTTFGTADTPVVSAPTDATVDADINPAMTLTKTSSPNPAGPVGSTVTYSFVVTNTGNQTLNTISVSDPLLPGLVCEVDELLRGETLLCSEDYTLLQEDVDRGSLTNTATVSGLNPAGAPVTGPGGAPIGATEETAIPSAQPSMTVVKTASPTTLGPVGSSVTYTFTVTNTGLTTLRNISVTDVLDPTAPCTIASIAPSGVDQTCTYQATVTQEMVDAGSLTNTVAVAGTDDQGRPASAGDEITTPGPERIPGLEVTKIATTDGQSVGSTVTYFLQVENTGNVTLDVGAIDDTMTRNNGTATALTTPFVLQSGDADNDGRLDVDEVFVYSATHVITQSDINAGGFVNTVTVNADGPPGTDPIFDVSDDGDDADGNTEDDVTEFNITSEPQMTTVKAVTNTTGSSVGDSVTWTITVRNTGNVDITGVGIADTLARADGTLIPGQVPTNTSGTTDLPAGGEIVYTLTYVLQQEDIDAGGLSNSALVTGQAPDGSSVEDTSADDDQFDGNTEDDTTDLVIPAAPGLEVIKTVETAGTQTGDVVTFLIAAENTGNVTLSDLAVADNLTRADGTPLSPNSVVFVPELGQTEGTLAVGDTHTYRVSYTLQLEDVDAGGIANSATVTGTSPLGAEFSDVSTDDDPSGNGLSDPTVMPIAPAPTNSIVKASSEPIILLPTVFRVTFTIDVTNTGNITQTGYQVTDDLRDFQGSAQILTEAPFQIVVRSSGFTGGSPNGAYDGLTDINTLLGDASLAPGETGTIEIDVDYQVDAGTTLGANEAQVTSAEVTTPTVSNSVVVASPDNDGDGIPNTLEACDPLSANDRDGDGVCDADDFDPTGYFYCEEDGRILPGGVITVTGPAGSQTGLGSSNNIRIVQDGSDGQFVFFVTRPGTYTLSAAYPSVGVPSTTRLTSGNVDATTLLPANPASIGSSEFLNSNRLADFTAGANPFFTSFTFELGDPFIINNNLPLEACAGTPDILATKQADRNSAVFGETVNFTLGFTNNTSNPVTNMNLVDLLPAGMLYTPGSATVDGAALEPTVDGLRLTWAGLNINPAQTITVTLSARVVSGGTVGELTNRAFMTDAAGNLLSNTATATVRIEPEHVFDCADIIGKVYDDRNQNGYQDEGEPGLPGIRLATVRGYLITTDEYGRYHVPCAELPKEIGSNFTLKLDTRTLPTGYRVTTENPRVIRVTAGKFAKLNFGAALSNVIDIDLTAAAFLSGTTKPKPQLAAGVDQLIASIKSTPSVVRLSYIQRGEDRRTALARIKSVEALIRERWRGPGRYKLIIERTIKRVKGASQ